MNRSNQLEALRDDDSTIAESCWKTVKDAMAISGGIGALQTEDRPARVHFVGCSRKEWSFPFERLLEIFPRGVEISLVGLNTLDYPVLPQDGGALTDWDAKVLKPTQVSPGVELGAYAWTYQQFLRSEFFQGDADFVVMFHPGLTQHFFAWYPVMGYLGKRRILTLITTYEMCPVPLEDERGATATFLHTVGLRVVSSCLHNEHRAACAIDELYANGAVFLVHGVFGEFRSSSDRAYMPVRAALREKCAMNFLPQVDCYALQHDEMMTPVQAVASAAEGARRGAAAAGMCEAAVREFVNEAMSTSNFPSEDVELWRSGDALSSPNTTKFDFLAQQLEIESRLPE
ncbi:hypothetical protein CYMTET_17336 [Cymbomonas tetramitiformis]|uniref:Mitochondrial splicing suppressor 51-like C-terminal domain-containing protein n=1 Tax=Cymbomonas tetramitiformis TaxID=36881 RepID=A0AAE0GAA3_9CHLO|nr:hypothetical protein CYMTET_17336 [Cymbomonas tetramitiformis]